MKQLKIILFLIIFIFNSHSEEHKKKYQRRELMYQYLLLAAGGLITGYFTTKYVKNSHEMSKVLTWKNDSEWEDRFFNLYQNKGITLQYINLICDNFASTVLTECIQAFALVKENSQNQPEYIEAEKKSEQMLQEINENYNNYTEDELQQKIEEFVQSQQLKNSVQTLFEKQSQYCLNFYHFQRKYSFLSKYMFDLQYVMTYYKILNSGRDFEQFLTEEELQFPENKKNELLIKEENIFKDFLKVIDNLIETDDSWQKINQQFVTTYYTIHNIFTKQGERSIELKRK